MIFPEEKHSIGYIYDQKKDNEVYGFGDYMRKITHLLKDTDKKWELVCAATDIQNTNWASVEPYRNRLKKFETELTNYISTHQDPFAL